jgi:VanZ family protein
MNKLLKVIAVLFFLFIAWIIFSANTGRNNIFFNVVNTIPYGDKLGHFFLFGILTLLLNLALRFKRFRLWKRIPLGTVLVSIFVILEELSQAFFPNRTMDVIDLVADAVGIVIFTFIGYWMFDKQAVNQ